MVPAISRPGMAGDRGLRESGQRRIRDAARALQAIGDAAQPGAEHDGDVGAVDAEPLRRGLRRALHAFEEPGAQLHHPPAFAFRIGQFGQKRRERPSERARRLDVRDVACAGDGREARARDRGGDLLHLGGRRHLVAVTAHDQHRAGDRRQLARSVGAVAQRLDAGDQAGGACLGARAQVRDQRGGRGGGQQAWQAGCQVRGGAVTVDDLDRGRASGARLGAVGSGARVGEDQRRQPLAVAGGERERGVAAHRHTEQRRARDVQAVEQRGQVVGQIGERVASAVERRVAEAARVDGDDAPVRGQLVREPRPDVAREREWVQQHERCAIAAIVVVNCRHA